jgi:hypothetical protein
VTAPERDESDPEIVEKVVESDPRAPERAVISVLFWETTPERLLTVFERVVRFPERVFTVFVRLERVVLVLASPPESVAISALFWDTIPERLVTVFERVEREPERVLIWVWRLFMLPERAFCARVSVK